MNPTHCARSDHPEKLHGVYPRDKNDSAQWDWVYGICCFCGQRVRGDRYKPTPWVSLDFIIEEEPV
ncbi:MAG TPA: hypothetical protein VFH56_02880 [Acidimicrobiales bacterium]|nr:hypothetical protein [Acidimicrobiales bacterium]